MNAEDHLTVSQVAKLLSCHPETVRRLDRRGELEAKRDYRGFRIFNIEQVLKVKKKRERLQ